MPGSIGARAFVAYYTGRMPTEPRFKPGDKVKRIGSTHRNAKFGEVYTVKEGGSWPLAFEEIEGSYAASQFALVERAERAPEFGRLLLRPSQWQPGDVRDGMVVEDVSPAFHDRVFVKFKDRPIAIAYVDTPRYLDRPDPNPTVTLTITLPKAIVERIAADGFGWGDVSLSALIEAARNALG